MKALCMHNQSHQAAIKTRVPFENREEELAPSVRHFWESQVEGLWMPPEMGFINQRKDKGRTGPGQFITYSSGKGALGGEALFLFVRPVYLISA